MKVHHLNCGTLSPLIGERNVCHVLLVETANGLVLVDSGLGMSDIATPGRRVGPIRHLIRPSLDRSETALSQVIALGYSASDVRHIIATHLDLDHIGGASDFPLAAVHSMTTEADSAYSGRISSRIRYNRIQLRKRQQDIVGHSRGSEVWHGFDGVTPLTDIADGIALVPLPGHTNGHTGVLVEADARSIFHCGDAFYHRNAIHGNEAVPPAIRTFERLAATDHALVRQNHRRLRELRDLDDPELLIVCAHDEQLLGHAQRTA